MVLGTKYFYVFTEKEKEKKMSAIKFSESV